MKRRIFPGLKTCIFMLLMLSLFSNAASAQAPTSLEYPGVNVFRTVVDNVFLAPTVSGNVTSYSITPALPAGLSFDVNTGIITGTTSAAFGPITYTITATNASGSVAATLSLQAFNQYYNNANGQVSFLEANTVPKVYATLATAGQAQGDIVLFTSVVTIGGVAIDCIVTTRIVNNVSSWNAYDQPLVSGPSYNSNSDNFFSPQITYGANGGSMTFDFQFILGGTYDDVTNTGLDITLQNVKLNTYDIDGNNTAIQYNEFGGFNTSELGTTTNELVSFNTATGLTRYTSNTPTNTPTITDPVNRVRVSYNEMSSFTIVVGADNSGLAFFFLDFSVGGAFTTNATPAPSLDLNTTKIGVNNAVSGCGATLNFTGGTTQTNAASVTDLTEFTLRFSTASILNGANEKLILNGATAGGSIALNFLNGAVIPDVAFGAVITYDVTATVANGISTLSFMRTSGTSLFTLARAEALADALQYQNTALSPTNAKRKFITNIRNTLFRSPDAVYTVTLNCVSIKGNIYHDANALTDNLVNANGTMTQFANSSMYGILVDPLTSVVLKIQPITSSAYNFGTATPAKYRILFSDDTPPAIGDTYTASTFPPGGYISTGEHLGAGAGSDYLADGKLTVTVGSVSVINANFGLQIPPTAIGVNQTSSGNPGGYNFKTIPGAAFGTGDADGNVASITLTSFPTNTNYLKVGSTVYISGGTCPPQSTCMLWPGTLTMAVASGVPVSTIAIDPIDGNTTAVISYTSRDNGNAFSPVATVDVPFTVPATPLALSGKVWNDANGDGVLNGAEVATNAAASGELLYAVLIQNTSTYSTAPTILASAAVNASGLYNFPNVPAGNDYSVRILSRSAAPIDGAAETGLTASLATNYVGVSTNNSGTITTGFNTNNLINTAPAFNASKVNVNFGIERLPTANNATHTIPLPAYGSTKSLTASNAMSALAGSDPEDGAKGIGSKVKIKSVAGMNGNILKYNGVTLAANSVITNYDATLLTITFAGGGSITASFTFVFTDNAGIDGATPATYTINWATVLSVSLTSFEAAKNGKTVSITWETANEQSIAVYNVQRSSNGIDWNTIASQPPHGNGNYIATDNIPLKGTNLYRLQIANQNSSFSYSGVRKVNFDSDQKAIIAWPNPVVDKLSLSVAGNYAFGNAEIVNNTGQVVTRSKLNGTITEIDMQRLATGIYTVRITGTDNIITTIKVIKK